MKIMPTSNAESGVGAPGPPPPTSPADCEASISSVVMMTFVIANVADLSQRIPDTLGLCYDLNVYCLSWSKTRVGESRLCRVVS
jgi:hypothetical protein